MKTDGNGRDKPFPISAPAFSHRKWGRVGNTRERERDRGKRVCGNEPMRTENHQKRAGMDNIKSGT
jgi:hypothetical protein